METEELKEIIKAGENSKVDFKRQWYEKDDLNKEFIKDMLALANGSVHTIEETAYLIIGITDDKREFFDFQYSFKSLEKLKQQLLTQLNNYAQPEFLSLEIEWVELEEEQEVLVLSVLPHGRLISLSKDLQLKRNSDKKGTTYYRVGEDIRVASVEVIEDFKKAFAKNENKGGIVINQTHSGSGDNIARDKIVYQKSE